MKINAATQRSIAVSTVAILNGSCTEAPVLLQVGDVAIRQAALVLAMGSSPWVSRSRAGSVLARKAEHWRKAAEGSTGQARQAGNEAGELHNVDVRPGRDLAGREV